MKQKRFFLPQSEMPRKWYNLVADLPTPLNPPVGLDGNPVSPQALSAIFPENLIEQEVSQERWIDIPEEVLEMLAHWRPSPLVRAYALEKALGTPAKIYYKDESVSPTGSHKPNSAVAQAWYNKEFGVKKLTTETGAGQWGSSLSFACSLLGLECKVFMVRVSFDQKPFRKMMMETWGGQCISSPSNMTETGRKILATDPDTPGSLGIAISEAIEVAVNDKSGQTRYALGSVLNHVMLHQTIIGQEAQKQLKMAGVDKPDIVIGCCGGGSNFAGISFPFMYDKINGSDIEIIGAEPSSCPTLTKAPFVYDYGDIAKKTPLLPMYSLGHNFIPAPIHSGGLRFHGMSPLVSAALKDNLMRAVAIGQEECFKAGFLFAKTEGVIPAPETTHAIAATIREALKAKEEQKEKTILFNFSGHGLMDLMGYDKFLNNKIKDYEYPEIEIAKNLKKIADYPKPMM